ncbi:hypothetical protein [Emergencia timonensis]|uniref:hypothetical protein n=1 Tax=Emergencia timonensis TaxID=1776384 RepID=UPI00266BFF8B|nr:hypothetical protein [Emergencia timonensis]
MSGHKRRYAELLGAETKDLSIKAAVENDANYLSADYLISDRLLKYYIEQRRS